LLNIKDLEVYYGSIAAIKGISLEVYTGEIVSILGANGAGKSTTMRTISQLIKAKSGSIKYKGYELTKMNRIILSKLVSVMRPKGDKSSGL